MITIICIISNGSTDTLSNERKHTFKVTQFTCVYMVSPNRIELDTEMIKSIISSEYCPSYSICENMVDNVRSLIILVMFAINWMVQGH